MQRMNKDRFMVSNAIALLTGSLTQGLDLIKVRQQIFQEGKTYNGLGFGRGDNPVEMFKEVSL
jgi:hypothetical protein